MWEENWILFFCDYDDHCRLFSVVNVSRPPTVEYHITLGRCDILFAEASSEYVQEYI